MGGFESPPSINSKSEKNQACLRARPPARQDLATYPRKQQTTSAEQPTLVLTETLPGTVLSAILAASSQRGTQGISNDSNNAHSFGIKISRPLSVRTDDLFLRLLDAFLRGFYLWYFRHE